MDRHDREDLENHIRFMLDKRTEKIVSAVSRVGIWPAVAASIIASLLTTGGVMLLWGIFQ